jgi:CENP-Q, a CENPA-CAD centromere complex subunit
LTANTHTIGLLSAEVKEESSLLEQEREELAALERELADLEELDAKQEKRLHPFAQGRRLESSRTIIGEYEMRPVVKAPASTLAELEGDPEAKGVLDQLRHYLDSLQNNIEGTKDISVALAKSQAALDIFNWKHLGTDEYRQVYGIYAT